MSRTNKRDGEAKFKVIIYMIIIGDVHGAYNTLKALMSKLPKDDIVFVGDLIDRGPDSKKVVDFVKENKFACVLGNHEWMAENDFESWIGNGGMETLHSFKDNLDELFDFIKELPYFIEFEDVKDKYGRHLLVSHAGVHKRDTWQTDTEGMLWSREVPKIVPGTYQVFGHTIHRRPVIKDYWACIDTGGYARGGFLTALQFPSMKIFQQANIGNNI